MIKVKRGGVGQCKKDITITFAKKCFPLINLEANEMIS